MSTGKLILLSFIISVLILVTVGILAWILTIAPSWLFFLVAIIGTFFTMIFYVVYTTLEGMYGEE